MNDFDDWLKQQESKAIRRQRLADARAKGTHTKAEWQVLIEMFPFCVCCGSAHDKPTKDHITPIYAGGCDCIDNLQPMCRHCNSSKGPDGTDWRAFWVPGWRAEFYRRFSVEQTSA